MKRLAIPLVMCFFLGVACWPFDGEEALAAMTLRKAGGGKVQIVRSPEETIPVEGDDVPVQPGDLIRTYDGALAQVALEGDRVAWVGGIEQPTSGVPEAQMRILDTTSVESETGTVVAETKAPMKVRFGDATATSSNGVFRVDRRAGSARAASYTGTVRVAAPGEPNVTLDRLLESPATASDLRPAQPYHLEFDDPFDATRLEDVISLEKDLETQSAGFVAQLGKQKPNLSYFKALAGNTDVGAVKKYLRRPTIDLLLGFTIAMNTDAYSFGEALAEGFDYRDKGGSWGVIAAILRSDSKLLLADLSDIIVASGAVASGTGDEAAFTVAAAQKAESGSFQDGGSTPRDDGGVTQPPPGGGDNKPPAQDEDPPAQDCSGTADCAKEDIERRIFPSPEPSPSDVIDGTL
jgi:hypothetical protein